MRVYILFLALVALTLGSCTTAYKTGQTPDDVYYSPVRPQDEYVVAQQQDDRYYYGGGQDYYTDRYLRMRMTNPYRWSALDDYYFDNPYAYNYYGTYNNWYSPWNSYWAWNSYCNPYYISPIFIKNPIRFQQIPSRAVVFNPKSYLNNTPQVSTTNFKNSAAGGGSYYYTPNNNNRGGNTRYNNSNNSSRNYNYSNSGNSSNNRSYTPSNSTPTRSYNPSSSSNSSSSGRSSSSSSSSAPTRPPR